MFAVGVGIGALCVVCVLLLFNRCRSCHTPPFCTRSGANSPVAGCFFLKRQFYLHTAYKPPKNKHIFVDLFSIFAKQWACVFISHVLLYMLPAVYELKYDTNVCFKYAFPKRNRYYCERISFVIPSSGRNLFKKIRIAVIH